MGASSATSTWRLGQRMPITPGWPSRQLTPEEAERRRDQWRQDDEALRQEFLEFARLNGEHTWQDTVEGEES